MKHRGSWKSSHSKYMICSSIFKMFCLLCKSAALKCLKHHKHFVFFSILSGEKKSFQTVIYITVIVVRRILPSQIRNAFPCLIRANLNRVLQLERSPCRPQECLSIPYPTAGASDQASRSLQMNLYELTDTLPSLNPSSPSSFPSSIHICECYLTGLICQQHPKAFSSLSLCPSHLILPSCCPISANSIEEAVVPVSVEGSLKTWGQIRVQPRCIQVQLLFQPKGLLSTSLHLTLFSCNTLLHKMPVQGGETWCPRRTSP